MAVQEQNEGKAAIEQALANWEARMLELESEGLKPEEAMYQAAAELGIRIIPKGDSMSQGDSLLFLDSETSTDSEESPLAGDPN